MTTPQYQKIPGGELDSDLLEQVQEELHPKFGYHELSWYTSKVFYFHGYRFLGVFQ